VTLVLIALEKVISLFMKLLVISRGKRERRSWGRGKEERVDPF
jgi:hypothetical protein